MAITKHTHTLIEPIPSEDNKEIATVEMIKPRLIHIEDFALAIGSDVLASLIKGAEGDKEAVNKEVLAKLVTNLIHEDRFKLFNQALAKYLTIEAEEAELISIDDLFEIGVIVFGFFQGVSEKISELMPDTPLE